MHEIVADKIGLETGRYLLPCGCKVYVYFPGGTIHFQPSWVEPKCDELSRLWSEYWDSCRNGHSWDSLNRYVACLRHVGAWAVRVARMERERDMYPRPADRHDHPEQEKEEVTYAVA